MNTYTYAPGDGLPDTILETSRTDVWHIEWCQERIETCDECQCCLPAEWGEWDNRYPSAWRVTAIELHAICLDEDGEKYRQTRRLCPLCADEVEAEMMKRTPLAKAIALVRSIEVTDETVNRRAKALNELEELEAEMRRAS